MSTQKDIELEILNLCESEQNFNDYYPQIEEHILTKDKYTIFAFNNIFLFSLFVSFCNPILYSFYSFPQSFNLRDRQSRSKFIGDK